MSTAFENWMNRRRGGGVYGGPQPSRQPPPPPAPSQVRSAARKGPSAVDQLVELYQKQGKVEEAQQAVSDLGTSSGIGGLIERGTKTLVGGLGKVLGPVSKAGIATLDRASETALGEELDDRLGILNPLGAFNAGDDQKRGGSDDRSWWDRVTDPEYGFGQATVDTGWETVDRGIGFTGDVAYDPISYVAGAASKSVNAIGRTAREEMAQTLYRAGFDDSVVGSASKFGPAFLDDAAREMVNVKPPGLYFGIGDASVKIPGTTSLGRGLEKTFASARTTALSPITNRVNMAMRAPKNPQLREARRVLNAGREIDGVTPRLAAARMAFANDVKISGRMLKETAGRNLHKLVAGLSETEARAMTHIAQTGGGEAAAWREFYEGLHQIMREEGIPVGHIEGYLPQRWTKEWLEFADKDPLGRAVARAVNIDPTADPSAVQTRFIRGGSKIELPNGEVITIPERGAIADIQKAISDAIPNAPKVLEDDIRLLTASYIEEVAQAVGLRRAWKNLEQQGEDILQRLDDVAVEQLDELATVTVNKELRKVLTDVVKDRKEKIADRAQEAGKINEQLRKELSIQLDNHVKNLGNDHKELQGSLKVIRNEVKNINGQESVVREEFDKMRAQAFEKYSKAIDDLAQLDETTAAIEARQALQPIGELRDGGGILTDVAKASAEIERVKQTRIELERALDNQADAMGAIDDLQQQLEDISRQMWELDEVMDSPELLAERAAHLGVTFESGTEVVRRSAPDTTWSDRVERDFDIWEAGGGFDAEALRQAHAAEKYGEIAGSLKRRLNGRKSTFTKLLRRLEEAEAALDVPPLTGSELSAVARETGLSIGAARRAWRRERVLRDELREVGDKVRRGYDAENRRAAAAGAREQAARVYERAQARYDKVAERWQKLWSMADTPQRKAFYHNQLEAQRVADFEAVDNQLVSATQRLVTAMDEMVQTNVAHPTVKGQAAAERRVDELLSEIRDLRTLQARIFDAGELDDARRAALEAKAKALNPENEYFKVREQAVAFEADTYVLERMHRIYSKLEKDVPPIQGRTAKDWIDIRRDVKRAERNLAPLMQAAEERPWFKVVKPEVETLPELMERKSAITEQLAVLGEKPTHTPVSFDRAASARGRPSAAERQVLVDHLGELETAHHEAQAALKNAIYERNKRWPSADRWSGQVGEETWDSRPKDFTSGGTHIGSQTLTREEYMERQVANTLSEPRQRRTAATPVDVDQMPDIEEGVGAIDTFFDEEGRLLSLDETMGRKLEAEGSLRGLDRANEEIKILKETARATREAYNSALKAFGVKHRPKGGWGELRGDLLLMMPDGLGKTWNLNKAVPVTRAQLLDMANEKGIPITSRMGHEQIGAALGHRVSRMEQGGKRWESAVRRREALLQNSIDNALDNVIDNLPQKGRRAFESAAREAESDRYLARIRPWTKLEAELNNVERQLDLHRRVQQEGIEARRKLEEKARELVDDIDYAEELKSEAIEATARHADALERAEGGEIRRGLAADRVEGYAERVAKNQAAELAVPQARRPVVEAKLAALDQVEQRIGELEAAEIRRLDVDRAIAGLTEANVESIAQRTGSSKAAVAKIAKNVPEKLRKDKVTAGSVKKQLDGLKAVMDEAAKEGTPELLITERLYAQALAAQNKLDAEVSFAQGVKELDAKAQKTMAAFNRARREGTDAEKLAAAEATPAGAVMKMVLDGFTAIDSVVYPEGKGRVLSDTAQRLFGNFQEAYDDPNKWLNYWDQANQFFKTYATSTPGFHLRNFMSASFMNMTEGVGADESLEALGLWRRLNKATENGTVDKFLEKEITREQRMAFEGVFGSGASGAYSVAELGSLNVHGKLWNNPATRLSRRIGTNVEGSVRLALALNTTRRGGSALDAMARVTRIHFDYSDISNFDKGMKRPIPFWTFMSRNLPLQIEQMWTKPKAYVMYDHFVDNFDISEPGEVVPEWLDKIGGFPVARDVSWLGDRDAFVAPDLQHTRLESELGELIKDPTSLLAQTTPFARVPLELKFNQSAFYGGPVYDRNAEGLDKLKQMGMYAANNAVPPIAQLQRVAGMGDYAGKETERRLNYVGIPVKGVGDKERAAELRRRAYANAA